MKTLLTLMCCLHVFLVFAQPTETANASCDAFANENTDTNEILQTGLNNSTAMKTEKTKDAIISKGKDVLFLLNPGFKDNRLQPEDQLYYCPYNAMLEGVLIYYPELKEHFEIVYVDFPRPRNKVIELLGEANQSLPSLVINKSNFDTSSLNVKYGNDKMFLMGSEEILKYFAQLHNIPLPHP